MNYSVKIKSLKSVDELDGSWNHADLIELLKRFDYAEAEKLKPNELKAYLFMAIADFEPNEAAAIVLDYRLSEVLTDGQIDNISNEMLREKVSENYSDIFIHKTLFDINQLLFKAYNGKFPDAKANIIEFEMKAEQDDSTEISSELVLKVFRNGLSDTNLIKRLFGDQLEGKVSFPEAEGIIWDLKNKGDLQWQMITSEKWIKQDDFKMMEFEGTATPFIEESEED